MMKGPHMTASAIRRPDGSIEVQTAPTPHHAWQKLPLVRGVCNMAENLVVGYRYLMHSAEVSMGEELESEEPGRFEKWLTARLGDKFTKVLTTLAAFAGVGLAVVLFILVPTGLVGLLDRFVPLGSWRTLLESLIKLAILLGYMALVSRMKEIYRLFCYHGAEHKTIACYEAGEELTVENIRRHTRFHPRCGTSFLLIVILISFVVGSLLPWGNTLARMGLKLLTLPVVVGVAYEVIKLAGRYDNILTRIVSAPGLWLQRLTTHEPDDSMIEVAIAAVTPVLPQDPEEGRW